MVRIDDKVREVTGRLGATEKYSYTEMMNLALNRVAMRSINTSISSALYFVVTFQFIKFNLPNRGQELIKMP